MRLRSIALAALLAIATLLFLTLLLKHISYPLLWHDESDTVMFGQRVVEYGYPKVHGPKNVVYGLEPTKDTRVHDGTDAYTGAPWGYYYFAAIGVGLARYTDDIYARTALVRLPFASIGVLGMLLLLLTVRDSIDGAERRRWFAIIFWLLAAFSISLILHMREARYYGLVIFIACALVCVFVRHHVYAKLGYRAYVALTTGLLFLLFNTFYPVYPVFLTAFGLHHLGRALLGAGPRPERLLVFVRSCVPLVLSLATTLPLLLFFDFLAQVSDWRDNYGTAYRMNLLAVLYNLARYEFLIPALLMRIAVSIQLRLYAPNEPSPGLVHRRQIAGFLFTFLITYCLILSLSHSVWERFFISLSPVITMLFLLDAFTLWDLAHDSRTSARRLGSVMAALVAVCLLGTIWIRIPEFRGRIYEITHRYKGPLDFVIPHLIEKYPHPEDLVIATNYEEPALMYYLGSRVIVGYYGANLQNERNLQPDVIIPRNWDNHMRTLTAMGRRGSYEFTQFPVKNLDTNGFPGLSRIYRSRIYHHFRTQKPRKGERRFVILERSSSPPPVEK